MARDFRFRFEGSAEELLSYIKQECANNLLKQSGNADNGYVKGFGLDASYSVDGDVITINVKSIPPIFSWKQVDREITKKESAFRAKRIQ